MVRKTRAVGLADVAREAEVSISTASRVLNAVPTCIVSPEKRRRIHEAAARLRYRRNRNARLFSTGRTECIGLVIGPGLFTRWAQHATASLTFETVQGITERLAELNHTVMLVVTPERDADEFLRRQFLAEQRVDGVITTTALSEGLAGHFRSAQAAILSVQHTRPIGALPAVGVDSAPGIAAAAERLAALGHRRAGYVGFRATPPPHGTGDRQREWAAYCGQWGIVLDERFCRPAADETEAYLQVREMVQAGEMPGLLICSCDHYAVMAVRALIEAGRRVPEDVSVAGYDDAQYATASPVPLATIRIPRKEAGRMAAQMAVEMKRDPERPLGSTLLAATWVERASVGPCRRG